MKQETVKCFRWVNHDMTSEHDSKVKWRVGRWNKVKGDIVVCGNGLHASKTPFDSLKYRFGKRWFVAEARGTIIEEDDKFTASEMRLVKEVKMVKADWVRVSCAFAKRVLPLFEKRYPDDKRPRQAVSAAMRWVRCPCAKHKKDARAAGYAADAAAYAAAAVAAGAAYAAVYDAAYAADAAAGAADAAAGAAGAADAAAGAADAAYAADAAGKYNEREWQNKYLTRYVNKKLKKREGGKE